MDDYSKVTRVEVIDNSGRAYVAYRASVYLDVQDDGRTLKLFVSQRESDSPARGGGFNPYTCEHGKWVDTGCEICEQKPGGASRFPVRGEGTCICADPENCTVPVAGCRNPPQREGGG